MSPEILDMPGRTDFMLRVVQSFSVSAVMSRYHPEEPGLTVTEEGLNDSLKSSAAEASHLLLFVV